MAETVNFHGFPKECVKFFQDLAQKNSKQWFERHKNEYEEYVLAPSRAFVLDMGERLKNISPAIHADPRVNKSLFRLHRDIRFSKDKSPFKTNMGIWFWEGRGKRMECSGFYFHLAPPNLMLGAGFYCFPKPILEAYRQSVVHLKYGPSLKRALTQVSKRGAYNIGGVHYKRVPRGYDPEHKNAGLLLHNGLHLGKETKIPKEFYSRKLLDYCFTRYKDMAPVHKWLVGLTERL